MINSNTEEKIATIFTIKFLKKDLDRLYDQSGIGAKKNNSTVRTALAQHLLANGFSGVHVQQEHTAQTLDRLKEKVDDLPVTHVGKNPKFMYQDGVGEYLGKNDVLQLIEEVSNE